MFGRLGIWGALLPAAAALACTTQPVEGPARTPLRPPPSASPDAEPTESAHEARQAEAAPGATRAPSEPSPPPEEGSEDEGDIDDGFDQEASGPGAAPVREHPLASLDIDAIERMLRTDPASVGPMSLGRPSGGALFNGVQMEGGDHWTLVDPDEAWGTQETIAYLNAAVVRVHEQFPGSHKLAIGHISAKRGGPIRPHISHQSGRDVDIGYFYKDGSPWYRRATEKNLDVERTWAFVRALIVETDVELILIDYSIQRMLRAHAEKLGEPREWLDSVFRGNKAERPLIRHAKGHATHLHVRFYNPIAQETARRCLGSLVKLHLFKAPPRFVHHRVRKGETLAKIAKRYGTTVREIQRANGLRSTLIQAKRSYLIPQKGSHIALDPPAVIPPRRLPPVSRAAQARGR